MTEHSDPTRLSSSGEEPCRMMFMYWGRRGALPRFAYEAARAARQIPDIELATSISRQNERYDDFLEFEDDLHVVDTFRKDSGAILNLGRLFRIRRNLFEFLKARRITTVVDLMPHIWSPGVVSVFNRAGVRYCPIIHDATGHQGDGTGWVKAISDRTVKQADRVITLSTTVADALRARDPKMDKKLITLFHPDLEYGATGIRQPPEADKPLRLLFLGRIMEYKGLPLFLDTIDLLRARGVNVEIGLYGEGNLGPNAARLIEHGAQIVNRWLSEDEIADALTNYHCMVLSHTAASQSGVASTAFGAGLPVVATPVGGLVKQVVDGETGFLATDVSAGALADAITQLRDPATYQAITSNIAASRDQRSMVRFVEQVARHTCTS